MTPAARTGRAGWFELGEDGWRRQNRARPLGHLVREALQNAFDHGAPNVEVRLGERAIVIEDDARGLDRDEYAFTVFLGERDTPPTWRGRKGRGLKELIASADAATVETIGRAIVFDADGRRVEPSARRRGTRITLSRRTSAHERGEAETLLRLTIPPSGTRLRIGGREVRPPRPFRALEGCRLATIEIRHGEERAVERETRVDLYHPRAGEKAHLYEMGLPVEPWKLPWHADVQQRVPLAAERDAARDPFKGLLAAIVFEGLAADLDRAALGGAWVAEVLGSFAVSASALGAWSKKILPARAVLSVGGRADDRARQLGARVVDLSGLPRAAVDQIATVLEGADAFVARIEGPRREKTVDPGARAERFVALARWLAQELCGHDVAVRFFERDPAEPEGRIDAEYDRERRELRVNLRGRARLDDPLDSGNLALLLHELAHDASAEHDAAFLRRLESLAGRALRRIADRPADLAPFRRR